jgi:hypothetical protein
MTDQEQGAHGFGLAVCGQATIVDVRLAGIAKFVEAHDDAHHEIKRSNLRSRCRRREMAKSILEPPFHSLRTEADQMA